MTINPLDEIRREERAVSAAIAEAEAEAGAAVAEARKRAEQLVREARARGEASAERRYQAGRARALDESERILGEADQKTAALRRQADAHLPAAVDLVMAMVLPVPEER